MTTHEETQQRILALVQQRFGRTPKPEDTFAELGIDSLLMAEFSLAIEKEFQVRMDEGVLDLENVGELASYVDALRAKSSKK